MTTKGNLRPERSDRGSAAGLQRLHVCKKLQGTDRPAGVDTNGPISPSRSWGQRLKVQRPIIIMISPALKLASVSVVLLEGLQLELTGGKN